MRQALEAQIAEKKKKQEESQKKITEEEQKFEKDVLEKQPEPEPEPESLPIQATNSIVQGGSP